MADIARPARRSPASSGSARFWSRFFLALDVMIVVALAAAVGTMFWLYPEAWTQVYTGLGYGWVPALLWTGAALVTLRYRPAWLARYWNLWLAGAVAAVVSIGALSFFDSSYGTLAFVGLAGRWGSAGMGDSIMWGMVRLAPLVAVMPLLISSRRAGRGYWLALSCIGKGLWLAALYTALGIAYAARAFGRGLASLFRAENRPGWITAIVKSPVRLFSSLTGRSVQSRAPVAAEVVMPEPETKEEPAQEAKVPGAPAVFSSGSKWKLPSLDLLAPAEARSVDDKPLKEMAANIESALADHGVQVEVADIKSGPRIVRFGLQPGWVEKRGAVKEGEAPAVQGRVKVQSILARERDLSLAISSPSLRFEQVPGEALLGLEIPTPSPSKVTMREIMDGADFRKIATRGGLPIALGADAGGDSVAMDLSALPHMMIAGATGSGKSVCINSIVASMLLTKPPDQLRMLMVDPKQVELTPFNGIPHLVLPVITEVDEVSPMLRGLIREMTRRYKAMAEIGTRNISGYNAKAKEPMPYLVLIVDELADLMLVGGFEIEQSLVRLAQLGRAAGIHLVLATQRPSVKVVTGLLKANIPTRVAFAVASQVDARVILDSVGAEKLLGKGDMLLLNNDAPKPRRVQGTLVLDDEIEKLVEFWLDQKGPALPPINLEDDDEGELGDGVDESLVDRARELALRNPHMTSSLLERRLKIGGNRAEQIIEVLEDEGLLIPR
ncbi:MAG: DNA translocase FtsK [Chloroflexota bacterium]|nr:DNA translocase FtsK [Chloroflexota bacterium]